MKIPNTMMKNLLGNFVLARTQTYARLMVFSGSSELTEAERNVINLDLATSVYQNSWSNIVAEMVKTRQTLATYVSGVLPRTQGIGKFSLSLGEATYSTTGTVIGAEMGLMLVFIGNASSQYYMTIALSIGPTGSGADVEVNNTISSNNMIAAFGDLILNFE